MEIVYWACLFLSALVIHEVSHGVVAYKLGDTTARDAGRLTLNPLKHIDPFWTILFPVLLFISTQGRFMMGMAKPVPVNFSRLNHPRHGMILVALAGPLSNLALAALLNTVWKFSGNIYFLYAIYVNLGLAIFNMIPVPPLDGSRVLAGFLPGRAAVQLLKWDKIGYIAVMVLYATGILFKVVVPAMNFFCRILDVPVIGNSF